MNYNEFKAILKKSSTKILFVGILTLLIGLPILCANFYDTSKAYYWILGGLFTAIGLLMLVQAMKQMGQINTNTHPLLSAILKRNEDFVLWIYQKEITSNVEGVKVGKSNNVVIWTNTDKQIELVLGKKTSPAELITYLSSQFPKARLGYSEELKKEITLQLRNRK